MWKSFWSILEPALIYNEFSIFDVISEEDYRKKVLHWGDECIDTTRDALDIEQFLEQEMRP